MVSKAVHDLDSHDIGIHFTVFCLLLMTPWSSTVQIQFSVKWKKSPHRLLPTYYQLDFRSQGKKDPWLLFAMFLHLVITTSSVCASTLEVVSLGFFSLLTIHAKLRKTSARREILPKKKYLKYSKSQKTKSSWKFYFRTNLRFSLKRFLSKTYLGSFAHFWSFFGGPTDYF